MINGREGIRKETTVDQFEGNIVPASWRDWGKPKTQVKIADLQVRFKIEISRMQNRRCTHSIPAFPS
jgi:hypothetical protein